jgi:hypothetical protein
MSLYIKLRLILVIEVLTSHSIQCTTPAVPKRLRFAKHLDLMALCRTPYVLSVMPSIELCSRVKCNAVLYYGQGWTNGFCTRDCEKNGLLRSFSVSVEKTAIRGFRGGTLRSSCRNISVSREHRWEQMCYKISPKLQVLNVGITYIKSCSDKCTLFIICYLIQFILKIVQHVSNHVTVHPQVLNY